MLDYNYQSEVNIACLLEDVEYEERKNALFKIVNIFKENKIEYGIVCSFNLFLRGVVDEFYDFDFIVNITMIPAIKKSMEQLGAVLVSSGGNGYCESDVYLHYQLGRVDLDIISEVMLCL